MQGQAPERLPWLIFLYRLPPRPDYLRVKLQRRLRRLGARALRNGVHVLPDGEEFQEDLT